MIHYNSYHGNKCVCQVYCWFLHVLWCLNTSSRINIDSCLAIMVHCPALYMYMYVVLCGGVCAVSGGWGGVCAVSGGWSVQ